MMEPNYQPKGWLGLIMGSRLYYSFHGDELNDEAVFESHVDSLIREIGDRGKVGLSEAVPPAAKSWQSTSTASAPPPPPSQMQTRCEPSASDNIMGSASDNHMSAFLATQLREQVEENRRQQREIGKLRQEAAEAQL
jgi:hypothetical protein